MNPSTDRDPHVTLHRAGERFRTATGWLDSRHSFSAGAHYDPANTHFGLLLLHNEDRVTPGRGYDEHPHRDTEIVTWVLEGELEHRDTGSGRVQRVAPGAVQRLGAGSGVRHSEHATPERGVRFVQMWVVPDAPGGDPEYALREATPEPGEPVVLASGLARHRDVTVLPLRQRQAALSVVRLRPGGVSDLPTAPFVHAFVARGAADLEASGVVLDTGDAARIVDDGGRRLTAGAAGAEILVWEMHGALGY
ncbi:pirin family protein [Pseudonocardia parietis]|uniref:Redox-sensitive bicupin YhaK (Pirin superfamily) n=1 Tax=Pseudonocardia parietis TaxID=570936 RepID=A0ABS4W139_9PSEU|nr:pirin family protein [Pseudonocardia parietis]MBP2369930.1 redox-sensitive bicupin YhaK (pirin superfamily) [Pseudonocardia parietis]